MLQRLADMLFTAFGYSLRAHHITRGPSFFGDHKFLGGLYEEYLGTYDSVVELSMAADMPVKDEASFKACAGAAMTSTDTNALFKNLIAQEENIRKEIDALLAPDKAPEGICNFLQGEATASLERTYKLKQRVS